ncbi:hypothetical protein M9H77_05433 [Catharanthus roseus]|uniref:Uncharacterized protein n=1 Tax=Catharanthus roseus TaxID=4058 RepID=A0ACC0CH12_CATRO|nr:hypothetical protein M9H77_05433 [Catharanthus roseus]
MMRSLNSFLDVSQYPGNLLSFCVKNKAKQDENPISNSKTPSQPLQKLRQGIISLSISGNMITRSKLVEQLRDYQIRSQHKCPALTVFSPKPFLTTWSDVVLAICFALLFGALVILSYVALYLRYYRVSFVFVCTGVFLPLRLRISRHALARKKERLLPLWYSHYSNSIFSHEAPKDFIGVIHDIACKPPNMCGKLNKGRNVATPAYDGKPMKCEGLVDDESFKGEDELILVVWDPCVLL